MTEKKSKILTKEQLKKRLNESKTVTFNDFDASLTHRLKGGFNKNKPKLEFLLWTFPHGQEIAFQKIEVPIDQQEVEYQGKRYLIDKNKIQNRLGVPTYNHTVNDTTGGLAFKHKSKDQKEIDAKNYAEGVRRGHFTALWGQWKLPFIALIIAMVVALALAFVTMYAFSLWKEESVKRAIADNCLNDLSNQCLQEQIQKNIVKAQQLAEEQAKKDEESKKGGKK